MRGRLSRRKARENVWWPVETGFFLIGWKRRQIITLSQSQSILFLFTFVLVSMSSRRLDQDSLIWSFHSAIVAASVWPVPISWSHTAFVAATFSDPVLVVSRAKSRNFSMSSYGKVDNKWGLFILQWNLTFEPSLREKLDSTYRENGIIGCKITNIELKREVSFCSNY